MHAVMHVTGGRLGETRTRRSPAEKPEGMAAGVQHALPEPRLLEFIWHDRVFGVFECWRGPGIETQALRRGRTIGAPVSRGKGPNGGPCMRQAWLGVAAENDRGADGRCPTNSSGCAPRFAGFPARTPSSATDQPHAALLLDSRDGWCPADLRDDADKPTRCGPGEASEARQGKGGAVPIRQRATATSAVPPAASAKRAENDGCGKRSNIASAHANATWRHAVGGAEIA